MGYVRVALRLLALPSADSPADGDSLPAMRRRWTFWALSVCAGEDAREGDSVQCGAAHIEDDGDSNCRLEGSYLVERAWVELSIR